MSPTQLHPCGHSQDAGSALPQAVPAATEAAASRQEDEVAGTVSAVTVTPGPGVAGASAAAEAGGLLETVRACGTSAAASPCAQLGSKNARRQPRAPPLQASGSALPQAAPAATEAAASRQEGEVAGTVSAVTMTPGPGVAGASAAAEAGGLLETVRACGTSAAASPCAQLGSMNARHQPRAPPLQASGSALPQAVPAATEAAASRQEGEVAGTVSAVTMTPGPGVAGASAAAEAGGLLETVRACGTSAAASPCTQLGSKNARHQPRAPPLQASGSALPQAVPAATEAAASRQEDEVAGTVSAVTMTPGPGVAGASAAAEAGGLLETVRACGTSAAASPCAQLGSKNARHQPRAPPLQASGSALPQAVPAATEAAASRQEGEVAGTVSAVTMTPGPGVAGASAAAEAGGLLETVRACGTSAAASPCAQLGSKSARHQPRAPPLQASGSALPQAVPAATEAAASRQEGEVAGTVSAVTVTPGPGVAGASAAAEAGGLLETVRACGTSAAASPCAQLGSKSARHQPRAPPLQASGSALPQAVPAATEAAALRQEGEVAGTVSAVTVTPGPGVAGASAAAEAGGLLETVRACGTSAAASPCAQLGSKSARHQPRAPPLQASGSALPQAVPAAPEAAASRQEGEVAGTVSAVTMTPGPGVAGASAAAEAGGLLETVRACGTRAAASPCAQLGTQGSTLASFRQRAPAGGASSNRGRGVAARG